MSLEKTRAEVIASIWKAIAQSNVDLSAVPQEGQEKLVGVVADHVMMTINDLMDEEVLPDDFVDEYEEKIIWKGRPFLSIVETYVITSERLKIIRGFISRKVENFELIRLQDIDYKQNMGERALGLGDITIRGHDPSDPMVVLRNVTKPEEVYETLRRAWLEARKRHGLQFREYM
jgi:hypothetical protein